MVERIIAPEVSRLISEKRFDEIKKLIGSFHPEDIATLISEIEDAHGKILVFRLIPSDKIIDAFENLEPDPQKDILQALSDEKAREILNEMAPDERTELFEEMPAELVTNFLNLLSPQARKISTELLGYPEDSVGRLITPEFVQLYEDMSVGQAFEHIRSVGLDTEIVYHCYVLDKEKRLIGLVSLKKLVLADPARKIREIMNTDVIKVNVYIDREEAAQIFKKYDLLALPAVDNTNKLLGIVTFDDFVDVLEDEATEDFEKIAAVLPVDKPYMEANFFEIVWKRSFWLLVLLALESLSGFVLQNYSSTISRVVALTFFLPILIGTGGNSGTQSATVIIRSLATGQIQPSEFFRVVIREASLGVFIGVILAVFGLIRAFLQQGDWWLSMSVGISMGITIVLSTTVGASLPLVVRKFRFDPALMSGPLITTIVDVVGIAIYFEIAQILLKLS
ncbi:MAG: magnesium transporter [Candidatus Omnitrophica bacterium]|nr:magnesium transporter [Candidatus Omnitrophota bacterium]